MSRGIRMPELCVVHSRTCREGNARQLLRFVFLLRMKIIAWLLLLLPAHSPSPPRRRSGGPTSRGRRRKVPDRRGETAAGMERSGGQGRGLEDTARGRRPQHAGHRRRHDLVHGGDHRRQKQFLYGINRHDGKIVHHKLIFENPDPEPLGNPINNYAAPSCVLEADALMFTAAPTAPRGSIPRTARSSGSGATSNAAISAGRVRRRCF